MIELSEILEKYHIANTAMAVLLIALGIFVARIVSVSFARGLRRRLTEQQAILVKRITFYTVIALFVASAIQQLGFNIGTLLGATGILTIAIGIASQTSISNIISGIFIVGEKPFGIGDTIKINDTEGEVMSVDFLSVKIRTPDNMMVRIPNEMLVKTPIINISYFPKRRVDLEISVANKTNLTELKQILFDTAEKNSICLKDPVPSFAIMNFNASTITIKFSVWAIRENFTEAKNSIQENIKEAFEKSGIEIPFPTHSLHLNERAEPLSIKIVS
jgi:small-conductance mechanosensitive channel